ncbi:MAG: MarR family transcriptional regulator [Paludibacteraceae bacterium]|nr:MarR family transcriptional regulator [Paludibacteraceae bacterium]
MYEQLLLKNQLCYRLYAASRLLTQAYQPYLAPLGLTYPQYLVMMILWEEGALPVNDIAHRISLETNTVTPLIQRLERQGLVQRQRGTADSRQRIISLTTQGQELKQRAVEVPECMEQDITNFVTHAQQLEQMIPMLDELIEGLSKKQEKSRSKRRSCN